MWQKIKEYFQQVVSELRKTTWPSKEATKNMTILVLLSVAFLALFIGLVDFFLQKIMTVLL